MTTFRTNFAAALPVIEIADYSRARRPLQTATET
jgi:hypothetical protein